MLFQKRLEALLFKANCLKLWFWSRGGKTCKCHATPYTYLFFCFQNVNEGFPSDINFAFVFLGEKKEVKPQCGSNTARNWLPWKWKSRLKYV